MKKLSFEAFEYLKNKDLINTLGNYLEIGMDSLTESDALKQIPIVNTLTAGGKFILSVRDQIFLNKMFSFFESIEDMPQEEIDEFIKDMDEKDSREIGEKLIVIVEKSDSKRKARLLGILFKLYLRKRLDKDNLELLSHCVDRAYIIDLYQLYYFGENQETMENIDDRLGSSLLACGLANIEVVSKDKDMNMFHQPSEGIKATVFKNYYQINQWGIMLRPALKEVIEMQTGKSLPPISKNQS